MEDVAAIVLAAGRSERMRAFKPLLPFGNSTVIDACLQNLRDGGVETLVVVLAEDLLAQELKRHLQNAQVTFAINPNQGSEMSDSIACGVEQLPDSTKAVLVTPADYPAVPPEVVSRLIREWQQGATLVVPAFNKRGGHPVLIDISFRSELLNLDSRHGLRTLFEAHPDHVRRLPVDSNYIARDMDTWDDYRVLHEEVFGVSPAESGIEK